MGVDCSCKQHVHEYLLPNFAEFKFREKQSAWRAESQQFDRNLKHVKIIPQNRHLTSVFLNKRVPCFLETINYIPKFSNSIPTLYAKV